MNTISFIGLGTMGGTLARVLLRGGHQLTVWNRTSEKTAPLVEEGAKPATSVGEAVAASPVTIVCIDSYATTRSLMDTQEVLDAFSGRILVQLSTGTPGEAQESAEWSRQHNITYIDGAIECLPSAVGTKDALFLFAGPEDGYRTVEPLLQCLGGDIRYLGDNIRAPAALDLAWLSQRLGQIIGGLHGIRLCQAEDVDIEAFANMLPDGDRVQLLARRIAEERYHDPDVTVRVWDAVVRRFEEQAREAGMNDAFPAFAAGLIGHTIQAGYGDEDVAAMIKMLQNS
ncbi:NAD(P)-dependent oxidoreductase [Roseibium sp.]|uniref:NAD(P)-dependent oxidoreductase n=1 Tax=Roseibium sp. TaxID=1936156 RepID=UPI003D13B70E